MRNEFKWARMRLQLAELDVYVVHEAMEVSSFAIVERQAVVEEIHLQGLAAADAAPPVETAQRRDRGAAWEKLQHAAFEETEVPRLVDELLPQVVELVDDALLGGIAGVAVALESFGV